MLCSLPPLGSMHMELPTEDGGVVRISCFFLQRLQQRLLRNVQLALWQTLQQKLCHVLLSFS